MRCAHRVIGLVIAVTTSSSGVLSGIASAQPDEKKSDPAAIALKLFRDSDELYRQGEFERAVELLRRSYDMYPEPLVLYNLARTLEGMGDFPAAVVEYERYLAEGNNINDRRGIERRVVTLKAYITAMQTGARVVIPTSPEIGAIVSPVAPPTGPVDRGPRRRLPWLQIAIAGTGLVAVGIGGGVGAMSDSRHDQAVTEPVQREAARLQDEAESLATTANVLLIGGAMVAIGGAVWGVIEYRRGRRAESPQPGSARLQVGPAYVGVEWTLP